MRSVLAFIIWLSLLSVFAYGQDSNVQNIDEKIPQQSDLEQLLIEHADAFTFNIKGKTLKYSQAVDTFILSKQKSQLPRKFFQRDMPKPSINQSGQLLQIVSIINKLPNDRVAYLGSKDSIFRKINSTSPNEARLFAILYYGSHFLEYYNSEAFHKTYEELSNQVLAKCTHQFDSAKCYEVIGDFYSHELNIPSSYDAYMQAWNIYSTQGKEYLFDIARLETRIASLYAKLYDNDFLSKAREHYSRAKLFYYTFGDTLAAFEAELNAIHSYFKYQDYKLDTTFHYDLRVINAAFENSIKRKATVSVSYRIVLYLTSAEILLMKGDSASIKAAKTYCYAALMLSMSPGNMDLNLANDVFKALSNIYLLSGNLTYADAFLQMPIQISLESKIYRIAINDKLTLCYNHWLNVKDYSVPQFVNGVLNSIDELPWSSFAKENSRQFGNIIQVNIFEQLGLMDSVNVYRKKKEEFVPVLNSIKSQISNTEAGLGLKQLNFLSQKKDEEISEQKEANVRNILISVAALVGSLLFFRNRIKQKNAKLLQERERLGSMTKAKLHSTKNVFGSFIHLAKDEENFNPYSNSNVFAVKSAFYISYALDIDHNLPWTLAQELELLDRYHESMLILHPNLKVEPRIIGCEPNKTLFIPEVFTTLLENSVLHGFQEKSATEMSILTIVVERKGNLLHVQIFDNGDASEIPTYIFKEKPNKGLHILKRRVETELKLAKRWSKHTKEFRCGPNTRYGSITKFVFPYGISA